MGDTVAKALPTEGVTESFARKSSSTSGIDETASSPPSRSEVRSHLARAPSFHPFAWPASQLLEQAKEEIGNHRFLAGAELLKAYVTRRLLDAGMIARHLRRSGSPRLERILDAFQSLIEDLNSLDSDAPAQTELSNWIEQEATAKTPEDKLIAAIFEEKNKSNEENASFIQRKVEAKPHSTVYDEYLTGLFRDLLAKEFEARGATEKEARGLADSIADNLPSSATSTFNLNSIPQAQAAAALAFSGFQASQSYSAAFNRSSESGAEELSPWEIARRAKLEAAMAAEDSQRRHRESSFDYYQRVWGPLRDAGILYRDDIERLGHPNLVRVVGTYCDRHGLDADAILPSKVAQRVPDELSEIDPTTARAEVLRALLRNRSNVAKTVAKQKI